MSALVHVHVWETWLHVGDRRSSGVEWKPGLTVGHLVPITMLGLRGLTAHKNGVEVHADALDVTPVSPNDHIDFAVRPAGLEAVTVALISAAVSAGISFVISLILPKPKGPKKRGDEESPTYSWQGSDNVRVEGQPRQVVYGEIRFAPQILDEFVRTTSVPPQSDLYLLLGLGEGAIQAIGDRETDSPAFEWLSSETSSLPRGIEIESNPISNFSGVKCQVRMGTREQEPLIGFEQIHTLSTVGQTLTQQETAATTNSGTAWALTSFPFNSNDATVQAIWSQYAQGFDLPSAADSITATVDFPEGLYKLSTDGALVDAYFQALIRYRELDGGGTPITTGGDNGDGWVYAPPAPALVAHHQGVFSHELGTILYSSAGYTPGTPGRILDATATSSYAYTSASNGGAAANANTPWTAGALIGAITVEGWIKPSSLPTTGTGAATVRGIFEWMTTAGGHRGVALGLVRQTTNAGSDTPIQVWHLRAQWGPGGGGPQQRTAVTASIGTAWTHVAFTYFREPSGAYKRVRIYVNGALQIEAYGGFDEILAAAAPIYLSRTTTVEDSFGSPLTSFGLMRIDEWRVWSTERTAQQIAASYGAGAGQFGVSSSDIVAGWHFDGPDVLASFTYSNDYGPRNNDITTSGSATMCDPTTASQSVVYRSGTGTQKRARYRVQLLRFNLKSTSTYIGDRSEWTSVDGIIEEQLAYPNTALLALKIPATDQLNTSTPRVTLVAKGRKVPVWDGVSTVAPSVTEQWSANPAWICLDMLTNRRYGRGGDYNLARGDIDLVSLKEWADYCDELLYDARGSTALHSTTSTAPIANLKYDSTLFSGTGGIEISFRVGFSPPNHWTVGGHLGFAGVAAPPTSGILVDLNAIPGFEIGSMVFASSAWTVTIKYPTATYGAPWADGAFLSTVLNPTAATGNVQGREVRFRFDGVFDTFGKVWDQLLLVAGTARATPVLEGRTIRFRVARPRTPVGILTHASIKPDSFKVQYTGPAERPNAYTADFLDSDRNWARASAERLSPDVEVSAPEGAFNRENVELFGITRRSQVLRDLDFRLAVNRLLVRQGSFECGPQAVPYESGDVFVISHDLVPWGVGGRFAGTVTGTSIEVDRALTLESGKTYFVQVRFNALGQTGSGESTSEYLETREITSAAGTYAAGATITIASAFTFDPVKDDEYVVYHAAQQKLAEVAEATLGPDNSRTLSWIQYLDDTFDVDVLPQDIPPELQFATAGTPSSPNQIPAPALSLTLREQQSRDASGAWIPEVRASWRLDPATAEHVAEVAILQRLEGAGAFEEVARVRGPATSVALRPAVAPGASLEVAVQPITFLGRRMAPLLCARSSVTIAGLHVPPPAPTNLRAVFDGDQVTYLWDPPANARGLSYELRRGGWILGQRIGVAPEGARSYGPTRDWSASKSNLAGAGPPPILVRARDARGHYSEAAILTGFNPSVPGSEVLVPPNVLGKRVNGDTRWEDWGTGWAGGSPATTLIGLEVYTLVDGREVLRFTGSNLTGTFETAVGTIDTDSKPERCYVEAFAIADQVAPLTADDETLGADDPIASRLTAEGAIARLAGESTGCTLAIEWRYKLTPSASYSDWQTFTPGIYYFVAPQFRLSITRPDTTWDAWVYSLGTRISRVAPQKFQKTAVHAALEASALSLG